MEDKDKKIVERIVKLNEEVPEPYLILLSKQVDVEDPAECIRSLISERFAYRTEKGNIRLVNKKQNR